ncbi:MAG TPA: 23S rRNA methyltransferase [Micromonosporaceae bacterium]
MLHEVVALLRCPVCHKPLSRDNGVLRCSARHSFDIARHGYVSLLAGKPRSGDTAGMVAARHEFLAGGHFRWLANLLAERASPGTAGVIVDAGAGTGYYLAAVLDRLPGLGIALDSSGYALRRAARAHPRIGAIRADLWRRLPIADRAATLLLNVFAPRNAAEFHRILSPAGALLTVTPTGQHLAELVAPLGLLSVAADKPSRLEGALGEWFRTEHAAEHRVTLRLDRPQVTALAGMGPSAWHIDPDRLAARIAALPEPVEVTAGCQLTVWRPR